jgi:dUTP pyrophosphatase
MNQVKVKRLSDTATIPTRGSAEAAGFDLYADIDNFEKEVLIPSGCVRKIPTGISIAAPEGTFAAIFARSGMATKRGLAPANKVGVVDSDYRGEVIVALQNNSPEPQLITHGERIAQLVIIPYYVAELLEVNELDSTERGDAGFGSTDNK